MSQPKILAFAGSAREGSFNKKVVQIAAEGAKSAGAEVTYLDFRNLPIPLFDEDLESDQGFPKNVVTLKQLMRENDGFLIACPEYNSSITPLLKNVIDWASRPEADVPPLSAFKDKVAVLMSASPSALGGMRGLVHVRAILESIGVLVLPTQKSIRNANDAFTDDGNLKDAQQQEAVEGLGKHLTETIRKLKA